MKFLLGAVASLLLVSASLGQLPPSGSVTLLADVDGELSTPDGILVTDAPLIEVLDSPFPSIPGSVALLEFPLDELQGLPDDSEVFGRLRLDVVESVATGASVFGYAGDGTITPEDADLPSELLGATFSFDPSGDLDVFFSFSGDTFETLLETSTHLGLQVTGLLGSEFRFAATENQTGFHPELTIEYAPAPPPGDFNRDFIVDAADYTVYRDGLEFGLFVEEDYTVWADNYGVQKDPESGQPIPEPQTSVFILIGSVSVLTKSRRKKLDNRAVAR